MKKGLYYLYIITNYKRTILYTGITNDLERRIVEYYNGKEESFTKKYQVYLLLYYESSKYINNIIARKKEIKGWIKQKKIELITEFNPERKFLNKELFGTWPPEE